MPQPHESLYGNIPRAPTPLALRDDLIQKHDTISMNRLRQNKPDNGPPHGLKEYAYIMYPCNT